MGSASLKRIRSGADPDLQLEGKLCNESLGERRFQWVPKTKSLVRGSEGQSNYLKLINSFNLISVFSLLIHNDRIECSKMPRVSKMPTPLTRIASCRLYFSCVFPHSDISGTILCS